MTWNTFLFFFKKHKTSNLVHFHNNHNSYQKNFFIVKLKLPGVSIAVVPSRAPPTSRRRRHHAGTATAPPPLHRERAREWRHKRAMMRRERVCRVASEHRRASAQVTARTSERHRRRRREQHAQAQHKSGLPMVWIGLVARCDRQCGARQSHRLCCPRRTTNPSASRASRGCRGRKAC